MKIPKFLNKGDKVAIVCPASYIKGNIDIALTLLKEWGLEVEVGTTVSSQFHQFGGNDVLRTQDLQQALDNPEIKAVFAARGGYGTVRIIDQIDFSNFVKNPKWLIGFSDITVLHSHIHNQLGIATLHGQMPKSFDDSSQEALASLKAALFGESMDYSYRQVDFPNRSGEATGELIGGNLAILQSILSSPSDGSYDGKVLFIEDVGESFYNIDRMLWTLKRAKKLDKLAGLIVGGFTSLNDSDPSFGQGFEEIIMDKVSAYNYPVAFGYPAGHIDNNHTLVMGAKIQLSVKNEETSVKYLND